MSSALLPGIDALALWRRELDRGVESLVRNLGELSLLDDDDVAMATSLRDRLSTDRLVLAFVAEFSRGKSELINALFFADGGRRVMPATPGRTTMCPVELGWDAQLPAQLQLLPMATRTSGQTVAELRLQPEQWRVLQFAAEDADGLAKAMDEITRVQRVHIDEARRLGFWDDERPEDNPPADVRGFVDVPVWRHARLNHPHPLLRRGLVVIDTPGLNAVGAEPELTLGLLPSAHATVFVLAADAGVTRADLDVWRHHLSDHARQRFVVLNKIDALNDPLGTPASVEAQLQRQCDDSARVLGVDRAQVFPLSARAALVARIQGDDAALIGSRLPALEDALLNQLLPRRSQVIGQMADEGVHALQRSAQQRLNERLRRSQEHLSELNGLRGKSVSKLQRVTQRLDAEGERFESCVPRLNALRAVLGRESRHLLESLSGEQVRNAVSEMRGESQSSFLKLGAARAFNRLCERLRDQLLSTQRQVDEVDSMLRNSLRQLNAEAGLGLTEAPKPHLDTYFNELDRIESGYSHYVSITQVWRLAQPGFMEQFSRTLQGRLRVVFEGSAHDIEVWLRKAGAQMDEQLRDHRRGLRQRREAHARIRAAESGLERSISEIQAQQLQLQQVAERMATEVAALRRLAASPPHDAGAASAARLRLVTAATAPPQAASGGG